MPGAFWRPVFLLGFLACRAFCGTLDWRCSQQFRDYFVELFLRYFDLRVAHIVGEVGHRLSPADL